MCKNFFKNIRRIIFILDYNIIKICWKKYIISTLISNSVKNELIIQPSDSIKSRKRKKKREKNQFRSNHPHTSDARLSLITNLHGTTTPTSAYTYMGVYVYRRSILSRKFSSFSLFYA